MRIPQTYVQNCKKAAHILQALLIFIAFCLTIAVFTKGTVDGRVRYYFALCFLTAPALLYLAMVPMFTRTQRFGNAYAFAAVDILYTIFWFAAFIAVSTWNSAGIKKGAEDNKDDKDEGGCATFAFGTESMCNLGKTLVGFGVIIFLLFIITSAISVYGALQFRKNGVMPGSSAYENPTSIEAQTKDAWSAEPDVGNEPDDGPYDDPRAGRMGPREDDEYALLRPSGAEAHHQDRPNSWGGASTASELDTSYHGARQDAYDELDAGPPNAGGYRDDGPATFPKANYSFSGADTR